MFCKECGTENLDTQYECLKCKNIINTNLPLNGIERLSIIGFFVICLATIFFGIIPIIICLSIFYIIKKDKNIKSLDYGKKWFLSYLIILSIVLSTISFYMYKSMENDSAKYYKDYLQDKSDKYYLERSNSSKNQSLVLLFTSLVAVPLGLFFTYWLSNNLFFKILKRHEQWIIGNGIFTDLKNEKSFIEKTTEKIQTIKKEPINITDELLKLAELKEKGLITEEEFQKAKEKILE